MTSIQERSRRAISETPEAMISYAVYTKEKYPCGQKTVIGMTAKKLPDQPSRTRQLLAMIAVTVLGDMAVRAARYATNLIIERAETAYYRHWICRGRKDPAQLMIIDASHALINGLASPEKWVNVYNQVGLVMPSMADYYAAARCSSTTTIIQIREDLENSIVHTSTMQSYSPDTLETKITHYHGFAKQAELPGTVKAPFLYSKNLLEAMSDPICLKYAQSLFGTEDGPDLIAANLSTLAGVPPENITLTTPPFEEVGMTAPRRHSPERSVSMAYARNGPHKFLIILADVASEAGVAHVLTTRR